MFFLSFTSSFTFSFLTLFANLMQLVVLSPRTGSFFWGKQQVWSHTSKLQSCLGLHSEGLWGNTG